MRHLFAALALAAVLIIPASASAAFKNGTYTGKYKQGGKVTFVVKKGKIVSIKSSGLPWECEQGTYDGSVKITQGPEYDGTPVKSDGTFSSAFASPVPGTTSGPENPPDQWSFKGKLSSKGTASGSAAFRHSEPNGVDEEGSREFSRCFTGKMSFTAKLK